MARYRDFGRYLGSIMRNKGIQTQQLAESTEVKPATVNAWKTGQRIPSPEMSKKLAVVLFPGDDAELDRSALLEKIDAVRQEPPQLGMLESLDSRKRALRIGSATYFGKKGLLDLLFDHFIRVSGIGKDLSSGSDYSISLKQQLLQDQVDIGLGLFATIDRALTVKFFPTPIRVGLNAILLDASLDRARLIKLPKSSKEKSLNESTIMDALLPTPAGDHRRKLIPIVCKYDVGGKYIRNIWNQQLPMRELDVFDPTRFVDELINREKMAESSPDSQIPVVVVDEITSVYILQILQDKGIGASLVFPMDNDDSVLDEKMALPEYPVSISVSRKNKELCEFLVDALKIFLTTEVHAISQIYVKHCLDLEALAATTIPANPSSRRFEKSLKKRQEIAHNWTGYCYRLSNKSFDGYYDDNLPWRGVLKAARSQLEKA